MLTRIEIDGFKSFENFSLDLMPFTVIVGPNASGKSNLFDALKLVSRLAGKGDLREAFQGLRGDPTELFRVESDGRVATTMSFAVELLLDGEFTDPFGEEFILAHTRLRYEVSIERRQDEKTGIERLYVRDEKAVPIRRDTDRWRIRSSVHYPEFKGLFRYKRTNNSPYLETEVRIDGFREVIARQDGVQGRPRPAQNATATLLSTITNPKEFRHLYALRQALAKLSFLQLDPTSSRQPSDLLVSDELIPDGANLAAVLFRLQQTGRTPEQPHGILNDVANDLAKLIPSISNVEAIRNEAARQYQFSVEQNNGQKFSSRVISDGTLRLLALVTVLNDPQRAGTLCFEEPENGVHERRVAPLIELLRESTHLSNTEIFPVLFQIVLNSHSPAVLACAKPYEVVGAEVETIVQQARPTRRRTRMTSGMNDQGDLLDTSRPLTIYDVDRLLKHKDYAA